MYVLTRLGNRDPTGQWSSQYPIAILRGDTRGNPDIHTKHVDKCYFGVLHFPHFTFTKETNSNTVRWERIAGSRAREHKDPAAHVTTLNLP